jgi:hypothetical protein
VDKKNTFHASPDIPITTAALHHHRLPAPQASKMLLPLTASLPSSKKIHSAQNNDKTPFWKTLSPQFIKRKNVKLHAGQSV